MFEDFENRMGFWKNLGSNFTIQYSGDAPSFMTDSEMWQSMDSGTTQTLAAWENGWVLTNNPDGTITANPKYTSGLPSETLTKVPVGFAPPTNTTPTSAGGGVVVAFNNEANLLEGYEVDSCMVGLYKESIWTVPTLAQMKSVMEHLLKSSLFVEHEGTGYG